MGLEGSSFFPKASAGGGEAIRAQDFMWQEAERMKRRVREKE